MHREDNKHEAVPFSYEMKFISSHHYTTLEIIILL